MHFFASNGGVKPLDYFIQMFKKNDLQVFRKAIFITPLLRNSHPVNCTLSGIYVFRCFFLFRNFFNGHRLHGRQLGTVRDVTMAIL